MRASVLIPWRETSGDRKRVFDWVLARCGALLPQAEICVADSGHEPFNRGASINRAAEESHGDVLLIEDADTFFHAEQVVEAMFRAQDCQTWVLPYDVYVNLDDVSTARLLSGVSTVEVDDKDVTAEFRLRDSVSGLIAITRWGFDQVGGFDENFRSWGYEDRAFECAADTLLNPSIRMPGYCYHLAHVPGDRFEQPHIAYNRARAEEYRRLLGQPEAMRQLAAR